MMIMLKKASITQFVRFCITGFINAGIDFTVYLGLTRLFHFWSQHLVLATAIAFAIANTNSYIMNTYWAFKAVGRHHIQYPKFLTVSLVGLSLNALCFQILVGQFQLHDIIGKIIVAGIVLVWNFSANKLWTFAHEI